MARRAHKPDPTARRQVEAMAGYGVPETDIAGVIGIDPKTLRKHYRSELDHGHVKANAKVAENLYRKATGEGRESVIAAIFWLKTRAGWRETNVHEIGGFNSRPIEVDSAERARDPGAQACGDSGQTPAHRYRASAVNVSTPTPAPDEHDPTLAQRRHVEALAGYGFVKDDIATVMAVKSEVLCLHYPGELAVEPQ